MDATIEALRPALQDVLSQLALEVTSTQVDQLLAYVALLQRWNTHYNLTSVREPAQMLTQHLADCLAVVAPLRRQAAGSALRLLDVGSGGGLPGVVLAVLNPGFDITCVDTVGKKAAFIQQVAGELRLANLHARHARVEQLNDEVFQVVTSRAFASLADFTRLTLGRLATSGVWMAMKGKVPTDEMADLPANVEVFHVEQLAVPGLAADRCLVWMRLV